MNPLDLSLKTILITGAASGIGKESAIICSKLGAKVILLDISEEGLCETKRLLESDGHSIYVVDLCDSSALSRVIEQIWTHYEIVDGLVHCAGISSRKPLNVLTKNGFNKVMDINFYSFVDLVRKITKKTRFSDGGSIIVMSSISSIKGYKAKTEYCVSKASVDAFVRCMAIELANRRIRINSIMAAEVLTPMAKQAKELNDVLGVSEFNSPLGPSDPIEVANLIAFLLSDATKTISGTSIVIDGGASIV